MQTVIFAFLELEFPSENFSLVRSVSTKLSEFLKNFEKTSRTRGHCALGSPRAGSVFALVQRHCLLKHKRCHKEKGTQPNIILNSETCEQRQAACNPYLARQLSGFSTAGSKFLSIVCRARMISVGDNEVYTGSGLRGVIPYVKCVAAVFLSQVCS
jgi:hypothetical protein